MKKLALAFLALGLSLTAFAAPANYYTAVLNSQAVGEISEEMTALGVANLTKVENTATFRCPGCFAFQLTYTKLTVGGELKKTFTVQTRLDYRNNNIFVDRVR